MYLASTRARKDWLTLLKSMRLNLQASLNLSPFVDRDEVRILNHNRRERHAFETSCAPRMERALQYCLCWEAYTSS